MGTYPGLEAPDFAKPTSRLAFWRHIPQDEGRHSVATAAWAILCTPFGRKVASLLPMAASTIAGGLEGCDPSQPLPAVNQPHFTAPTERTPSRGSASHGLDCFRAESCSPLGE